MKIESVITIPASLWRDIKEALESAQLCDHPKVQKVLDAIEEAEKE